MFVKYSPIYPNQIFDLIQRHCDKYNPRVFLFNDDGPVGSVTPLFELIAAEEEVRRFTPEKWKVNLEVDSDNYEISKIISEFSLSNGGQFLSEVFGMEGLSGVGSTDVELMIKFNQIGEDFSIVIPQPAH